MHTFEVVRAKELKQNLRGSVLITGGGVYNAFLLERIKVYSSNEIVVPSKEMIVEGWFCDDCQIYCHNY